MTLIEALAIILSIVSLTITIIGFFASLKFYRDGVDLQNSANGALIKLEEKTALIQTQVGGMFDKTLDAAIGKKALLSESFADLNEQLEQTKAKIVEEALKQIGDAGEQERKRLSKVVDSQINLVREKVESTRESAEDFANETLRVNKYSIGGTILDVLPAKGVGLTLSEICTRTTWPSAVVNNILHRFYYAGLIQRVYTKDDVHYLANPEKVKSALYED